MLLSFFTSLCVNTNFDQFGYKRGYSLMREGSYYMQRCYIYMRTVDALIASTDIKASCWFTFQTTKQGLNRSSTLNRFIKYNNFWWIAVVGLWGNQLIYKSSILIAEIKVEMFFLEIRHFWYIILHESGYMKDKLVWVPEQKQCSIHIIIYNTYKS